MIGIRADQAKGMFFDQAKVKRAAGRAQARVFARFGAYVRRRARQSIRKRRRISKPGEPPSSHTGALKRFIYFVYDRAQQSVIVGPVLLPGKPGDAPEALEYGGRSATIEDGKRASMIIQPRPFMEPAFEEEQPKLPGMWRDAIR